MAINFRILQLHHRVVVAVVGSFFFFLAGAFGRCIIVVGRCDVGGRSDRPLPVRVGALRVDRMVYLIHYSPIENVVVLVPLLLQ